MLIALSWPCMICIDTTRPDHASPPEKPISSCPRHLKLTIGSPEILQPRLPWTQHCWCQPSSKWCQHWWLDPETKTGITKPYNQDSRRFSASMHSQACTPGCPEPCIYEDSSLATRANIDGYSDSWRLETRTCNLGDPDIQVYPNPNQKPAPWNQWTLKLSARLWEQPHQEPQRSLERYSNLWQPRNPNPQNQAPYYTSRPQISLPSTSKKYFWILWI